MSTPAPVRTYIVMTINCHWSFLQVKMPRDEQQLRLQLRLQLQLLLVLHGPHSVTTPMAVSSLRCICQLASNAVTCHKMLLLLLLESSPASLPLKWLCCHAGRRLCLCLGLGHKLQLQPTRPRLAFHNIFISIWSVPLSLPSSLSIPLSLSYSLTRCLCVSLKFKCSDEARRKMRLSPEWGKAQFKILSSHTHSHMYEPCLCTDISSVARPRPKSRASGPAPTRAAVCASALRFKIAAH